MRSCWALKHVASHFTSKKYTLWVPRSTRDVWSKVVQTSAETFCATAPVWPALGSAHIDGQLATICLPKT